MKLYQPLRDPYKTIPLLLVLCLGIFVRIYGLGSHFGHTDDLGVARTILAFKSADALPFEAILSRVKDEFPTGLFSRILHRIPEKTVQQDATFIREALESVLNGTYRLLSVPASWTYAPFQFFFTYFLVSADMSYQAILFWGRFPSFVSGSLALLVLIFFYAAYDRLRSQRVLIALILMTFSWPNILAAKMMHNYAMGVLAACMISLVFMEQVRDADYKMRRWALSACWLALGFYMHYQILFVVPAFFIALVVESVRKTSAVWNSLRRAGSAFLLWIVLVAPLFLVFLGRYADRGVTYLSRGVSGEYQLALTGGILDSIWKTAYFFVRNIPIVLRNNLALVPENHGLSPIIFWIELLLFGWGLWRFIASKKPSNQALSIFLALISATWAALIMTGRLALGPSRHTLILLPWMTIVVAEGWVGCTRLLQSRPAQRSATLCVALLSLLVFFSTFAEETRRRQDPFDEERLANLFKTYGVTKVIEYDCFNMGLMKMVTRERDFIGFFRKHGEREISFAAPRSRPAVVALVGTRAPLDQHNLEVLYSEEQPSDVEVEFSKLTVPNGSNGFYVYIMREREGELLEDAVIKSTKQ